MKKQILFTIIITMNKLMKTVLLTLTLLLSINNIVFAETIYTEGALNYVIRDGSIVVVGYFGTDKEVAVPDQIGGYLVTGVASGALTKDCIEKVILPETITAVEEGAIIEHAKVDVEDSYGNTIKENDISDIKVEDDFFIESEEYDILQELDISDDDVFTGETEQEETSKEVNTIEEQEDFEEVYSAKVSTTVEENNYTLIIVCVVAVVCVILFVTLKKRKKKQG